MIRKYTALCLLIIPMHISTADNPIARKIPEIFFIDQDNTVRMQTIQEGMERLKQEIRQETSATLSKHEQEHKAQQEKMKREHDENIKNHSRSFIARIQENAVIFTKQFEDNQKKSEEQAKKVQEVLNSSVTYQLTELNLTSKKAELVNHLAQVEKNKSWRIGLGITTTISSIFSIVSCCTGKENNFFNLPSSFLTHAIVGSLIYYVTDSSDLQNKITNNEETIKGLETILIRLRPANENKEDVTIKVDEEIEAQYDEIK